MANTLITIEWLGRDLERVVRELGVARDAPTRRYARQIGERIGLAAGLLSETDPRAAVKKSDGD